MSNRNKTPQEIKGREQKKNLKEEVAQEPRVPTEKERLLQKELADLDAELTESKARVEELRKENIWLQEESNRVRTENQEYMSYMTKKTNKRQSAVVSLNDYHRHQLLELQRQKEDLEQDFQKRKEALQATLLEKENELARLNRDLDALHEYKILHDDQRGQIRDLESEILTLRNKHSQSIRDLKSRYVEEKREFEKTSQARLDDEAKKANKEALQCLTEHTTRISDENRRLRHELMTLINQSQALNSHKHRLLAQRQQLLLECQYAEDLKAIRGRGNNNNNNSNTNNNSNNNNNNSCNDNGAGKRDGSSGNHSSKNSISSEDNNNSGNYISSKNRSRSSISNNNNRSNSSNNRPNTSTKSSTPLDKDEKNSTLSVTKDNRITVRFRSNSRATSNSATSRSDADNNSNSSHHASRNSIGSRVVAFSNS